MAHPVRDPVVAGLFYDRLPGKLSETLESYVQAHPSLPAGTNIFGLVVPHAGYVYSGHVAGQAYAHVKGRHFDTVVVIAPSHRDYFQGASLYRGDYRTPLGIVTTDQDVVERLLASGFPFKATELGHREEHSLEVQLPFLQHVLGDFKLVPMVMGIQEWDTCVAVAQHLVEALSGRRALIVASSDLSHYHTDAEARRLDGVVVRDIEALDEQKLQDDIRSRQCEACGAGPIMAAMMATKGLGARHARVVAYHTSGEVNHEWDEVVGYLSGLFYE